MKTLTPCLAALLACFVVSADAAQKVGVLLKAKSPFWASMEKGAVEAGQKLGLEVIVKSPVSESDVAAQVQLLNVLVAQGVDAVVIAPCDKVALSQPAAAAAAKGIKIVVVDSPISGGPEAAFVATDQHAAGKAAGDVLAGLIGDEDEVVILRNNQVSGAANEREAGAIEQLRTAKPKAALHSDIYASNERGVEDERCALVFTKYPKTKAIFSSGTPGTLAMLNRLASAHSDGSIKFVGCGFNLSPVVVEALQAGTLHAWIAQRPAQIGYQGVAAAAGLLKGEKVPAVSAVPFVVVTKDKLADPGVKALLSE